MFTTSIRPRARGRLGPPDSSGETQGLATRPRRPSEQFVPEPPSAPRRMASNFLALSFAEVLCRGVSMGTTLTLAQRLGRSNFGRIEFAFSVVFWLVLLVREGLDVLATREIARHPRLIRPLVNHILAIRGCLALMLLSGLYVVAQIGLSEPIEQRLFLLYGLLLLTTAIGVDFVYRGLERMRLIAVSLLVRTTVYAIGAWVWVTTPERVGWVPIWLVVGELCGIGLVWGRYIWTYGWPRPSLRGTRALRTILRKGRSVYVIQVSQAIIGSSDLLVVGLMSQWADVGLYGAPHRLISAILTFGIIFRQVVFPSLARSWRSDPEEGRQELDTMVRVLMLGLVPIAVGTTVLAEPLIQFLLTSEYSSSAPIMALGIWRIPLLTLAFLYQSALIAMNKERAGMMMLVIAAVVTGPLTAFMRYTMGLQGAALAMVLVGLGLLIAGHRRLAQEQRAPAWHHHVGRPALASMMMVPVCMLLTQWNVMAAVAGGAAVYGGMLVVLNGIEPNDLRTILKR